MHRVEKPDPAVGRFLWKKNAYVCKNVGACAFSKSVQFHKYISIRRKRK